MSVEAIKADAVSWLTFSNTAQLVGAALLVYPLITASKAERICIATGGLIMFVNYLASKRKAA